MEQLDHITFWATFGATQLSGIGVVIIMGIWTSVYRGGFAWQENPGLQFNWHPLLMSIGLIYLYGNGMLLYRVFRDGNKKTLKLLHAATMMGSFIFTVIALKAAFDSHDLKKGKDGQPAPIPNMYSLHSWMGIITAILFSMQWVAGFAMFLLPNIAQRFRAFYLNIHTWFGTFIFILGCATALLGVTEKMLFTTIFAPKPLKGFYQRKEAEGILVNIASLMIIVFATLVVYLGTSTKYKRTPKPEEIQTSHQGKA